MTTIGDRVRAAMQAASLRQNQVAQSVGMTPDALSRALGGHRGFAALEIAEIARVLDADVHELITGEPDPHRLVVSARHAFDHDTRQRRVDGADGDRAVLEDIQLAYAQAGEPPATPSLPSGVEEVRNLLHPDFVRDFIEHLAAIEVDVVRLDEVANDYSFTVESRPIIVLKATGNWFRENWSLAHELGHLALGHEGVLTVEDKVVPEEAAANAFAAELLLPEARLRDISWDALELAELAELVWSWGVSTDALSRRLSALALEPSGEVAEALTWTTQKLLRRHWTGARIGDPITQRMTDAGERRFPAWLKEAHLERIAAGKVGKGTLAWMLGVPSASLEVDEPESRPEIEDADLDALLG